MRTGMWNRRLRAMIATWGTLTLIAAAGTSFADDDGIVPVDGTTRDRIFQQILDLQIPGMDSLAVGIDPAGKNIGVTIFAPTGLPTIAIDRLKLGDNVTVNVVKAKGPKPQINLRGGNSFVRDTNGSGSVCTLGFAVGLRGGKSGFLTAGHCFDVYKPAEEQKAFAGPNSSISLTGHEKHLMPSDWGVYSIDDSPKRHDALPEVVNRTDGSPTPIPIHGMVEPTIGMHTCKRGITTGTTCGTVTMLNTTVIYPALKDGSGTVLMPQVMVKGLIQTDTCTESGDSGGPVYTTTDTGENMAVGITSGSVTTLGTDRCMSTIGEPDVSYVVPIAATTIGTHPSAAVFLKVAP